MQDALLQKPEQGSMHEISGQRFTTSTPLDELANVEWEEIFRVTKLNELGLKEWFHQKHLDDLGQALFRENVSGNSLHLLGDQDIENFKVGVPPHTTRLNIGQQLALRRLVYRVKGGVKMLVRKEAIWTEEEYRPPAPEKVDGILKKICPCTARKQEEVWRLKRDKYILTSVSLKLHQHSWADDGSLRRKRPMEFDVWCPLGHLSLCPCFRDPCLEPPQRLSVDNIDLSTVLDVDFSITEPSARKDLGAQDCYELLVERAPEMYHYPPAELIIVYTNLGDPTARKRTIVLQVDPKNVERTHMKINSAVEDAHAEDNGAQLVNTS